MRELSLNVLDIVQNSITANASKIEISVAVKGKLMTIKIEDNGCGMDKDTLLKVQNPFYTSRTTRKVGMGIPLFFMAAQMTGGSSSIDSEPGAGTKVEAVFNTESIDFTPLGNMGETLSTLISCNPDLHFIYSYCDLSSRFVLDTDELRETLSDVPLSNPDVALWIRDYVNEGMSREEG